MRDGRGGFAAIDSKTGTDGCGFLFEIEFWKPERLPIWDFCLMRRHPSPAIDCRDYV